MFDQIISLLSFVVTTLGLGAVYLQIRSANSAQARDHLRQRREATLDWARDAFEHLWLDHGGLPDFSDADAFREFASRPLDPDFLPNKAISKWLDLMEDLSVGVRLDVYDMKTVNAIIGTRVLRGWMHLEGWIAATRHRRIQPWLYEDVEWLAATIFRIRSIDQTLTEDVRTNFRPAERVGVFPTGSSR